MAFLETMAKLIERYNSFFTEGIVSGVPRTNSMYATAIHRRGGMRHIRDRKSVV